MNKPVRSIWTRVEIVAAILVTTWLVSSIASHTASYAVASRLGWFRAIREVADAWPPLAFNVVFAAVPFSMLGIAAVYDVSRRRATRSQAAGLAAGIAVIFLVQIALGVLVDYRVDPFIGLLASFAYVAITPIVGACHLLASYVVERRIRRRKGNVCTNCGYSLDGLPGRICPECGVMGVGSHTSSGSER